MRMLKSMIFAGISAVMLSSVAYAGEAQPILPRAPMTIETTKGPVRLDVELATTPREQEMGLMFRTAMPANDGMLFIFPDSAMRYFWMKNTVLPLDLVFIRADGRLSSVASNAKPFDETTIPSTEPVRYVLELNAGRAEALGLAAGEQAKGPALHPGH